MNAQNKIFSLIPKIMSEVGAISKDRKNLQQGYSFRGIDDLYSAMQGPLSDNGVFYAPKVLHKEREERTTKSGSTLIYTILTVQFTFFADDGSSFDVITVGEAMDSGDKSANKAMSAALKYALLQLFCIPTEEDNDTENQTHEVIPKTQTGRPPALPTSGNKGLGESGDYVVPFGKKFKGISLKLIEPDELESFMNFLKDSAKKDDKPLGPMAVEFCDRATEYLTLISWFGPKA